MARITGVHSPSRYTGLTTSNNLSDLINDIDVAVGSCFDSTGQNVLTLSTAITKRLDAVWAVGTNQGGLDTGVKAISSSYHIHIISNGSNTDVLFSLSATAPTMPSGYNVRRRVGSIVTGSDGSILRFVQTNDTFMCFNSQANTITPTTSPANYAIFGLPSGVPVVAAIMPTVNAFTNGTANAVNIGSPDGNATTPTVYAASPTGQLFYNGISGTGGTAGDFSTPIHASIGLINVATSNGQVKVVMSNISANVTVTLFGWRDLGLN